jgi:alpha-N-arabinofuranosidase
VFHVFDMYAKHQGAMVVRTEMSAGRVADVAGLSGSCSIQGNRAFLTVVNPDVQNARETQIEFFGAKIADVRARVLSATDIHARNTFEQPDAVKPVDDRVTPATPLVYSFRPASVTSLEIQLA